MEKKKIIKAFLAEDLMAILQAINKTDDFFDGLLQCAGCGAKINEDNLAAILPRKDGGYSFYCSMSSCVKGFQKE